MDADTPPPAPATSPRLGRWLRHLAIAAATLVVVGAAAYVVALPWVVRQVVAGLLRDAGVADATFTVKRATLWGTTLADVSAGAGAVRIESVDVSYAPLPVVRGEVGRIVIRGADVRVGLRDGKLQLPIELKPQPPENSAADTQKSPQPEDGPGGRTSNGAANVRLPFRKLEIVESAATVDWDGQTLRVPLSGVVDVKGENDLTARAEIQVDSPSGMLNLPNNAKLHGPGGVLRLDATLDAALTPAPAGGGLAWRAAARVANEGTVMVVTPDMTADLGRLAVSGTATSQSGASPAVDAVLTVESASLKHPASRLSLAGIGLTLPVTFGAADATTRPGKQHVTMATTTTTTTTTTTLAGSFGVASVMLDNEKLEPISGTASIRDGRADFAFHWAALPDTVLSANGWLARDDAGGVDGEIAADLAPFRLEDGTLLARRIPALEGWEISGRLGMNAKLAIAGGKPSGRVTVATAGADVASKDAGVELKGVDGTIAIDVGPAGVSTPAQPPQEITAARAAFGTIEMTDVSLAAVLQRRDALVIERLSANWLGGRVSTKGVRLNPTEPKFEATLVAERLSLRELLALAAEGRARGEGLMSGSIAVKVNWPQVSFGKGMLRSQSPTGELQVLDTQWLGATIDQSDPRFTTDRELAEVKQRILRALTDFAYDRLTFELAEEPQSRGLLRVSAHGKGRTAIRPGEQPQELDMTLNIRGVNDLLKYGLQGKARYDQLTNPGR